MLEIKTHLAWQEKGLGDSVESAGRWLAEKWESLEARYGRRGALAMALAGVATFPVPGNLAAIVGIAETIRGLSGWRKDLSWIQSGRGAELVKPPGYRGSATRKNPLARPFASSKGYGLPAIFWQGKGEGTCKPGQTAANTGCTPTSGEGSGGHSREEPKKESSDPSPVASDNKRASQLFSSGTPLREILSGAKWLVSHTRDRLGQVYSDRADAAVNQLAAATGKAPEKFRALIRRGSRMGGEIAGALKLNLQDAIDSLKTEDTPEERKRASEEVGISFADLYSAFNNTVMDLFSEWSDSGREKIRPILERAFLGRETTPEERDVLDRIWREEPPELYWTLHRPLSKSLQWQGKGEGTCKQGERADLTGCTPSSHEGSHATPTPRESVSSSRQHSYSSSTAPISDQFCAAIDDNNSLSPEQKQHYKASVSTATETMPEKAIERIKTNLKEQHFYKDQKSLAEGIARSSLDAVRAKAAKEGRGIRHEVLKTAIEQLTQEHVRNQTGGAYITGNGSIHLGGVGRTGELTVDAVGIYAHELTHAIDGPDFELSNGREFGMAYATEIWGTDSSPPKLTQYANTNHQEGFAEFGRLIFSPGVDLRAVAKKFPRTSKFFKSQGLWPRKAK